MRDLSLILLLALLAATILFTVIVTHWDSGPKKTAPVPSTSLSTPHRLAPQCVARPGVAPHRAARVSF
jgi:hypothetical protein